MSKYNTVSTPLPLNDNFPVELQISIRPYSSTYQAHVQVNDGKWHRFSIGLKSNDVVELNTELQNAVENLANVFDEDGHFDPADFNDALFNLAKKGAFAFERIFKDGPAQDLIKKALKPGSTIQITAEAEDFILPWELIYPEPLSMPIDATNFWGMQHIISRAVVQDIRPADELSPVIRSLRPRVGLVTYNGLEHVVNHEIPTFQQLQQDKQIELKILDPLLGTQYTASIQSFGQFLQEDMQIFHGAFHILEGKEPTQSYLLISDDFPITYEDFVAYKFAIAHSPFVILNACLSGTRCPHYTSSWASLLWERGARGVLATEFHVPDWFASAFIRELYKHLLKGNPIGQSLLATRQHFWNTSHNPSGLGYALYSSPSIQFLSEEGQGNVEPKEP
jgi:hypothetical protein